MNTFMEILGTIAEAAVEAMTAKNAKFSIEELEALSKAESILRKHNFNEKADGIRYADLIIEARNSAESKKTTTSTTTSSYTYEKPVVDSRSKIRKELKLERAFKENNFLVGHDYAKGFTYFYNSKCYSRAVWRNDKMYIFTVVNGCRKEIMKDLENVDPIVGWAVVFNSSGLSTRTYGSYTVCYDEIMKIAKSVM